jgi:outer membrane protein assembly factor BamB
MRRSAVLCCAVVGVLFLWCGSALADPSETVTPAIGHPSGVVTVTGGGFNAFETVDVYFDTTDMALASSSSAGAVSASLTVPASAVPGAHWVTLMGRKSGISIQKTFGVHTDWASYKYSPGGRGWNAFENVLSPSTVAGLDLAWSGKTGGTSGSSPVVANGAQKVFIGSWTDSSLYVLSAATHALLWKGQTAGGVIASPAVANAVVYASWNANVGGGVAAFPVAGCGAAVCAPSWSVALDGFPNAGAPVVSGGVVYIATSTGNVYAISTSTHTVLWHAVIGPLNTSPAVSGGSVYVSAFDGHVYAFPVGCRSDGGVCAAAQTSPPLSSTTATPAVSGTRLYVDGLGILYALRLSNLSVDWSVPIDGMAAVESPVVANGILYTTSHYGAALTAVSLTTHAVLWSSTVNRSDNAPAIANGVVYVHGNTDLYAFPALCSNPCAPLWTTAADDTGGSPVVSDGVLYAGTDTGLAAFDLPSGTLTPVRPNPASLVPNRSLKPQHNK